MTLQETIKELLELEAGGLGDSQVKIEININGEIHIKDLKLISLEYPDRFWKMEEQHIALAPEPIKLQIL